jgi:hypothetical protein
MGTTPPDSGVELHLGDAATEALSRIRAAFSRIHYAPSRKTILRAILDALPKWCMDDSDAFRGIQNHTILKHRSKFFISGRENKMLSEDLFSTSISNIDISVVVDFLLTAGLSEGTFDLRGAILKYLSGKQYLRGKNVLMFRLPARLEQQILPEVPVGESSGVDSWKSRYADLSGQHQSGLQKQLESLFLKATIVRKHWPPILPDRRKYQSEAREQVRGTQDANVVSVLLSEELLFKIKRMSEDNFETAAIATLLWCEDCAPFQKVDTTISSA